MASALMSAFGGSPGQSGRHAGAAGVVGSSPFNGQFYDGQYQRLKEKEPSGQASVQRPNAYLNFVLFNDQFKLVDENSGVKQVQAMPDEVQTLAKDGWW
ncbi:hypothetical protein MKQ70_36980 [Chitinophaga sedimenti]|uniref:hypothetical protein n=1 Tax=Chitinophaga sedimenti TaxID=2033606 RepID=UPI00200678DE|nr:hypothetical protein [Chitinophaga sedimenti]MCK7560207.1 hypothetical protein [Chitinophaga sedimenti]